MSGSNVGCGEVMLDASVVVVEVLVCHQTVVLEGTIVIGEGGPNRESTRNNNGIWFIVGGRLI